MEIDEVSDEEIDQFHSNRISEDEEEISESESSAEEVLGLDELSSDEDSAPEREVEQDKDIAKISSKWGKSRSNYFKQGDQSEEEDDESDDAEMEEKEASRLQKSKDSMVGKQDYELDDSEEDAPIMKSSKKKKSIKGKQLDRVASQAPELLGLLSEFKTHLTALSSRVHPVLHKLSDGSVATENGLSYLEAKSQAILTYCINIAFYLLLKSEGQSVKDHPVIAQLVRVRSVLERLKPLDAKLKNQIDDILKSADGIGKETSKPDAKELLIDDEEGSNSESEESSSEEPENCSRKTVSKTYIVPKVAATSFEESDGKRNKRAAQLKNKMKNNSMLSELRNEFSERPEEIPSVGVGFQDVKNREIDSERRKYEEDNFTRLVETKKEKLERRKREREADRAFTGFKDLDDFGDLDKIVQKSERMKEGGDDEARKQQELQRFMNKMEQEAHRDEKHKKKSSSGDGQAPARDPMAIGLLKTQRELVAEEIRMQEMADKKAMRMLKNQHVQVDSDAEDDVYREAVGKSRSKKQVKDKVYSFPERMEPSDQNDIVGVDQKRKASYKMLKNKGLQPHKKKEDRNPRVKKRKQYEAKLKSRAGQVKSIRTGEGDAYGGEAAGLRTQIVASRRPGR